MLFVDVDMFYKSAYDTDYQVYRACNSKMSVTNTIFGSTKWHSIFLYLMWNVIKGNYSARDSCNGYFRPWKSLNFSIQQKVLCDALMMD